MKIFGREPALWAALLASLAQGAGVWFGWTGEQLGAVNAIVAGALGIVVALAVKDGVGAAALGGVQAVLNLVLAFGLDLNVSTQAAVMTLAAALIGMFVRTQVTAKVAAPEALR